MYALKPNRTELPKDPVYYKKGECCQYRRHESLTCRTVTPLILTVADQSDHTRIRKHFAHAFSDSALFEQEPLLTHYFNLLVTKLKHRINGPARGLVGIMAYYNFATFDIIGHTYSLMTVDILV